MQSVIVGRGRLFVLLIALAAPATASAQSSAPPPLPPKSRASAPSPDMQAQRLELINKLIGAGVFQKIEKPRQLPYLWVRPGFYALDFDAKQKVVGVVYMYFKTDDPAVNFINLFDSRTGKKAGRFAPDLGGLDLE